LKSPVLPEALSAFSAASFPRELTHAQYQGRGIMPVANVSPQRPNMHER
jgi:hypothetical protein